jgi:hypothetical protein
MKTNLLVTLALLCALATHAATLVVVNGGDDNVPYPKSVNKPIRLELQPAPRAPLGESAIYIASMCSLSSPHLTQSRVNTVKGMWGGDVPTDRMITPAAWYRVPQTWGPNYGLQWFDGTVTLAKSFMGAPAPTNNVASDEHGHRWVISVAGKGNPNDFFVRLTTSITNIAPSYFSVSTNSADGTPLQFSFTYIGVDYGPNGVLDSAWNSSLGKVVAGGDDTVYDGSQPSPVYAHQVHIDYFTRFGSSVYITGNQPGDFTDVMDQFATTPVPWVHAELVSNDATVASELAVAAVPSLLAYRYTPTMARVVMIGGQYSFSYDIESAENLTGAPWLKIIGESLQLGSQGYRDYPSVNSERYFRLKARRTWSAPPPDL